jgi:hypothetical protein
MVVVKDVQNLVHIHAAHGVRDVRVLELVLNLILCLCVDVVNR